MRCILFVTSNHGGTQEGKARVADLLLPMRAGVQMAIGDEDTPGTVQSGHATDQEKLAYVDSSDHVKNYQSFIGQNAEIFKSGLTSHCEFYVLRSSKDYLLPRTCVEIDSGSDIY